MKQCINCKRMVEPLKRFNIGAFVVLFILGVFPAFIYLIYYLCKSGSCPMCNSKNWGLMEEA